MSDAPPFLCELVRVVAADGLRLEGALHAPTTACAACDLDAALLLHGVGSNFYGSTLTDSLARGLADAGLWVARANTRGHDHVSLAASATGPRRIGAALEKVGDCVHDLAGWVDFLIERGLSRLLLVGHSLGAIKALYTQSHQPLAAVSGIVALSPARLSYAAFRHGHESSRFGEALELAEQRLAAGRGEELIEVQFPFPLWMTATGYLEKYGPAETYNYLNFIARLPCPTLFVFGGRELESGSVAFAGAPEAIQGLTYHGPRPECRVIAGADHAYTGAGAALQQAIRPWLAAQFPRLEDP